jgi:pimeloyl-ACP methyl ester carboxylesterase
MQKVSFETRDKVSIKGNFYPVRKGYKEDMARVGTPQFSNGVYSHSKLERVILLLHMMPATKESWQEFAEKLAEAGWNVLAIDLRGHGESTWKDQARQRLYYKDFTDKEHQGSYKDIQASFDFLIKRGLKLKAIAGASIGANLALWWQAEHNRPQVSGFLEKTILLSVGFDYRGIQTQPLVVKLKDSQGLYLAGGSQDWRSSGQTCGQIAQKLYELAPVQNKKLEVLETASHGTDLFKIEPNLPQRLISWLG